MSAFILSTVLIFVAELGDKSQLVGLWFSTRYRWWLVLAGVTTATLVVHLGSVAIGRAFGQVLPDRILLTLVGLAFIAFGLWSIRGDAATDGETTIRARRFSGIGGFGVITVSFFLSELGDKTQLATVSLAGNQASAIGVWLGSTLGMVLADAVAIGVGSIAGRRLPDRAIKVAAAILFFIFGFASLLRAFLT